MDARHPGERARHSHSQPNSRTSCLLAVDSSSVSQPLVARDPAFCCVSQLFQTLLDALLNVAELWKKGDPGLHDELEAQTRRVYAAFATIGAVVQKEYRIPKSHDLIHIAMDMLLWGSSDSTSTGMAQQW